MTKTNTKRRSKRLAVLHADKRLTHVLIFQSRIAGWQQPKPYLRQAEPYVAEAIRLANAARKRGHIFSDELARMDNAVTSVQKILGEGRKEDYE